MATFFSLLSKKCFSLVSTAQTDIYYNSNVAAATATDTTVDKVLSVLMVNKLNHEDILVRVHLGLSYTLRRVFHLIFEFNYLIHCLKRFAESSIS